MAQELRLGLLTTFFILAGCADTRPPECIDPATAFEHLPEGEVSPDQKARWVETMNVWFELVSKLDRPPKDCAALQEWLCASLEFADKVRSRSFDRSRCESPKLTSASPSENDQCVAVFASVALKTSEFPSAFGKQAKQPGWCNGPMFASTMLSIMSRSGFIPEPGSVE